MKRSKGLGYLLSLSHAGAFGCLKLPEAQCSPVCKTAVITSTPPGSLDHYEDLKE
jgi:hypothetical protein